MPRINRDLERRLAARRERERRRPPTERRYRFSPSTTDELALGDAPEPSLEPQPVAVQQTAPAPRPARGSTARVPRTFSSYREEYTYVQQDLRRIVIVTGVLLLLVVMLSFIIRT